VLDLSRLELSDQTILTHLTEIRKHRKIRGLKLSQNNLTDAGLEAIMELLGTTTNLNLSRNKLTENALTLFINNIEKITTLRIVNMS
jgi:Ran GTPase-activating protein (RanGAP) involved in mRNA processing and transport